MSQTPAGTVRKQIVVDAPIDRAFRVFTDRFGDFKPPEHNLLRNPIAETVFEPRVGGNIVDRAADGSECRWARILVFEPPARVMFSWDISPRWSVETDPAQTSEVDVRFYAESATRTRVELEHRHIDRHGPGWEAVIDGVDGAEGWPLYLQRFEAVLAQASTAEASTAEASTPEASTPEASTAEATTRGSWQAPKSTVRPRPCSPTPPTPPGSRSGRRGSWTAIWTASPAGTAPRRSAPAA
jgi:uncharacterized protein YndB with AHSA1/START domain